MSKRDGELFPFMEGPPSKMAKEDDSGGRAGRVRKKSAKVLEMEEFEQAEKKAPSKSPGAKKTKSVKPIPESIDSAEKLSKKAKPAKTFSSGPMSSFSPAKVPKVSFHLEPDLTNSSIVTNIRITSGNKVEPIAEGNNKDSKSVIKHLLTSPAANVGVSDPVVSEKKIKKHKLPDLSSPKKVVKQKKVKSESVSEEISRSHQYDNVDTPTPSLKMKIISSSNPASALVSMGSPKSLDSEENKVKKKKVKKAEKKNLSDMTDSSGLESPEESRKSVKKSKKKEKLIQDAISSISAGNFSPSVATLGGSLNINETIHADSVQKVTKQKKKHKISSPLLSGESFSDSSQVRSDLEDDEVGLVIAETETKKKKTVLKKKVSSGKPGSPSPSKVKDKDSEKKLTKRAPTAYMMFCNATRPEIVAENPGIDFATISRKLGDIWQGLSNKQKLVWRKKAQKKMKKGSNLISTGKVGKLVQPVPAPSTQAESVHDSKTNSILLKTQRSPEDTPQSPTNQNYSIEPIDVAAHLKLLGESLSIIGMRLQEHKGMIAVQGSLSVLLDSLLCACGPLLSLTQQVPGMDGCPPLVHAKTLDSVAYVMPGL